MQTCWYFVFPGGMTINPCITLRDVIKGGLVKCGEMLGIHAAKKLPFTCTRMNGGI